MTFSANGFHFPLFLLVSHPHLGSDSRGENDAGFVKFGSIMWCQALRDSFLTISPELGLHKTTTGPWGRKYNGTIKSFQVLFVFVYFSGGQWRLKWQFLCHSSQFWKQTNVPCCWLYPLAPSCFPSSKHMEDPLKSFFFLQPEGQICCFSRACHGCLIINHPRPELNIFPSSSFH